MVEPEVRGRKMVRNSDNWKQSIRKRRRQSGKSYVNEKGKTVDKRKITKVMWR